MVAASGLFQDFDGLFKRFADKYKLVEFGRETGVEMKDRNTVVEVSSLSILRGRR